MYSSTLSLIPDLDGGGWVVNAPPRLSYPRERPGTHCTEGSVGPRVGLDGFRKSHHPPRFDPGTVQPVGSRYTNYSIPASFMQ